MIAIAWAFGWVLAMLVAPAFAQQTSVVVGLYELAPGHPVSIFAEDGHLLLIDYGSGEVRGLTPEAPLIYTAGPAIGLPRPIQSRIRFRVNNADSIVGFEWARADDTTTRVARRIYFRSEEVVFRNDAVTLAGTIIFPRGEGPFPGIVQTHAFGPATRSTAAAEWLAYLGLAALTYDKRGVGTSTGNWQIASMEDLASDAVVAVRTLGLRAGVDSTRIGLIGASQAGWVNAAAAARSRSVRFLVLLQAESRSVFDNGLSVAETRQRRAGATDGEIVVMRPFLREWRTALAGAVQSGAWGTVDSLASISQQRVRAPLSRPDTSSWQVEWARVNNDFNPVRYWKSIRIPVLAIYGGKDREIDVLLSAPALENTLRAAGNGDATVIVFPRANHHGLESESGFPDEEPRLTGFPATYWSTISQWLTGRLSATGNPRRD